MEHIEKTGKTENVEKAGIAVKRNNARVSMELRAMARAAGLCDEWFAAWPDDADADELAEKYVRGIDFCIAHDYPSVDYIKKEFDNELLGRHGIVVDGAIGAAHDNAPCLILNGHCDGKVRYDGFSVGSLYVRHNSRVFVHVWDFAKVFVEVYDNSEVTVVNHSRSKSFVYWNGGMVKTAGDVVVRRRNPKGLGLEK